MGWKVVFAPQALEQLEHIVRFHRARQSSSLTSYAQWSANSHEVSITFRIDRHLAVMVRYRIENGRVYLINGPSKVEGLPRH